MLSLSRLSCVGEALRDAVVTYKSNVALIECDRKRESARYTYAELTVAAERLGGALQAAEIGLGDRVAILMSNQAKWLISATGALWVGATLVPLDYKLTAPEQLALLAHCSPRVLVCEYSTWRKLATLDLEALDATIVLVTEAPDGAALEPSGASAVHRWEAAPQRRFQPVMRVRDDVACIVYSSGTGGTPKGCMLTHGNYLAQAEVLGRMYPLDESDRYFSLLPTNHAIDFMCGFIVPLLFGAAVVHQRTLRPKFLGPTMKRYGVTHMALVPMLLKRLEKRIREKLDELPAWQRTVVDGLISVNEMATRREPNHTLSSRLLKPIHDEFGKMKLMFCGGAFVDRGTAEFFYRLGLPVAIGYGLTEAGTVLTVNDLKPFRGDTVGKPVDGVSIELRDKNEAGVGEVWAGGPTVMKGYLDAPELTAETIVDGWLRTGDLGVFDAAGHLKLLGRAKNMIVTEGGKNIYPEDIEAAFEDLDDCEELCVFAANYLWPTGKLTDELLMVVLRPVRADGNGEPSDALLAELRKRNRRLVDFKRLNGYVVWNAEFPRTASMKIKRAALALQITSERSREQAMRAL